MGLMQDIPNHVNRGANGYIRQTSGICRGRFATKPLIAIFCYCFFLTGQTLRIIRPPSRQTNYYTRPSITIRTDVTGKKRRRAEIIAYWPFERRTRAAGFYYKIADQNE